MHDGNDYGYFGGMSASAVAQVAELLGVTAGPGATPQDPGLRAYPQAPASEGTPEGPDSEACAEQPVEPPAVPNPVSDRKRAANRANAAKSTGPKTDAGKAASKLNAVRHGLWAQTSILPGEEGDELADLATSFALDHGAGGAVERELATRAVAICWRLRRLARAEEAMASDHAIRVERGRGRMVEDGPRPDDWPDAARMTADDFVVGGAPGRIQQLMAAEARLSGQLTTVCRLLLAARERGGACGRG